MTIALVPTVYVLPEKFSFQLKDATPITTSNW
jgi:hypothetical protein